MPDAKVHFRIVVPSPLQKQVTMGLANATLLEQQGISALARKVGIQLFRY